MSRRETIPALAGSPTREGSRVGVLLALLGALAGCDGPAKAPPALPASPSVRVIAPRATPRLPFRMEVEARMLSPEECEVRVRLACASGGEGLLELDLPRGATVVPGAEGAETRRRCRLEPGVPREEVMRVRVPAGGHHLLAAVATVDGRRAEAYVEVGERPSAEARGLKVRSDGEGRPVLRLGPEDRNR